MSKQSESGFSATYAIASIAVISLVIASYADSAIALSELFAFRQTEDDAVKIVNQVQLVARHSQADGGSVSYPGVGRRGLQLATYDLMAPPVINPDTRPVGIELCHKISGKTQDLPISWFFGSFSTLPITGGICAGLFFELPVGASVELKPIFIFPVSQPLCQAINAKTGFRQKAARLYSRPADVESTRLAFNEATSLNDSASTRFITDTTIFCADQGTEKPSLLITSP